MRYLTLTTRLAARCPSLRISSVDNRRLNTQAQPVKMSFSVFEGAGSSGTPLIIMHGLFGSKLNWRSLSRALTNRIPGKIYTVDARNHGDSPHTADHGSAHLAVDVVHFMDNLGIQKANVMGHSMGGRAMMYMALKYPERVNSGIIIDISPVAVPRDFFKMEQMFVEMENISVPPELTLPQARILVGETIKKNVDDKATVDFIVMNLRKKESGGGFEWACNVKSLHENMRHFSVFVENFKDITPYRGSMMFIGGTKSNFLDPDHWPAIQGMFPQSEIHWLNTSHLVHFEKPQEFLELVVNFLQKVK